MLQNDFELTGRVSNIEVKYLDNGTCITRFCISKKSTRKGASEDEFMHFWIDMFGETAEQFANSIVKGDTANVTGKLQTDKYTDKSGKTIEKIVFKGWKFTKAEYDSNKKEFVSCTSSKSTKDVKEDKPWG